VLEGFGGGVDLGLGEFLEFVVLVMFELLNLLLFFPDLNHHFAPLLHVLYLTELFLMFELFHLIVDLFEFPGQ
jgi:hypothetical protein